MATKGRIAFDQIPGLTFDSGPRRQARRRWSARRVELGPACHAVDVGRPAPNLALKATGLREREVDVQHRGVRPEALTKPIDPV